MWRARFPDLPDPSRTLRDLAKRLLTEAGKEGVVDRLEVETLARDWLALVGAHDALRVLAGDAHEARHVVVLCERILRTIGEEADASVKGG